jgi:hypothetical protein
VNEAGGRGEAAQAIEQAISDAGLKPVNPGLIPALIAYAIRSNDWASMALSVWWT